MDLSQGSSAFSWECAARYRPAFCRSFLLRPCGWPCCGASGAYVTPMAASLHGTEYLCSNTEMPGGEQTALQFVEMMGEGVRTGSVGVKVDILLN